MVMIRFAAASALAVEIAIHVDLAPDHLHEIPYVGAGFVLASALLVLALVGVLRDARVGWLLGAGVCAGMAGLFVLSRTTGLPGLHEEWTSDHGLGLYALAGEAVFLLCAGGRRAWLVGVHADRRKWRLAGYRILTAPPGLSSPGGRSGAGSR
jgi:hypothetical protein